MSLKSLGKIYFIISSKLAIPIFSNFFFSISRAFKKEIAQGGKECCPYDNGDCVIGRQRDYPLSLYVSVCLLVCIVSGTNF